MMHGQINIIFSITECAVSNW